jgi:hypothetical protein
MRRNELFERNRRFRSDEGGNRRLHLTPRHSATMGHYSSPEPNEYSDDYYGPGDRYEGRGFEDDFNPPRQDERSDVGGIVLRPGDVRPTARPTDSGHYGEMHPGDQSWASLRRHMSHRQEESAPNHRGRGPKGYQRSDERLHEMICEMLTNDPDINASEVTVEVKGGEVTLTGNVDDRRTKYDIEHKIDRYTGVHEIRNQLRTWRPR